MENKEKVRVLLQHWIDHNTGHAEEFSKWQKISAEEGQSEVAENISEAIALMEKANESLTKALNAAGGPAKSDHHHDHHHHHHH